jgi:hypothetical protein
MIFIHPINYLQETKSLTNSCQSDLELNILYDKFFNYTSNSLVRQAWLSNYTTNISYLKESQKLLQNTTSVPIINTNKVKSLWNQMISNKGFKEKYEFITFDYFEQVNRSELFMQVIAMYTLTSPILSLSLPILLLFAPFFILNLQGKSITLLEYTNMLKKLFRYMPIGQIFEISSLSWDKRIFAVISVIFYFLQIYQNSVTCYKFYRNTTEIYTTLKTFENYFEESINTITIFNETCVNYNTYEKFTEQLSSVKNKLQELKNDFSKILPGTFIHMGKKLKYFYEIYSSKDYAEVLEYTFNFHEYINDLHIINENSALHQCKFSEKKCSLKNSYYGPLWNSKPISNSYSLNTNMMISGPNASGKTTLLKSTLFNLILSQQIGKGFYTKATIKPYDYFHCYINIPDTCERDSLFQAEVRRCKDILDVFNKHPNSNHFCIFDELFSGTNPYEAVASAQAYLLYLHKHSNIKYLLTTHYVDLCKYLDLNKEITNYTMEKPYHLQKGISTIKGGIKILEEQDFPDEIISSAKNYISLN